MILSSLWKLLRTVNKKNKRSIAVLLFLMLACSVTEIVGLGLIIPFVDLITGSKNAISTTHILNFFPKLHLNVLSVGLLAFLFSVAVMVANILRLFQLSLSTRLSFSIGHDISCKMFEGILRASYEEIKSTPSSEIVDGIVNKANAISTTVLFPLLNLIGSTILIVFVMAFIAFVSGWGVVGFVFVIFVIYALIVVATKKLLASNSITIANESIGLIKIIQESIHGFRDVIINDAKNDFLNEYRDNDQKLKNAQGKRLLIGQAPRFIIEGVGLVVFAIYIYLAYGNKGDGLSIGTIALVAVALQKLLPICQSMYVSLSGIIGWAAPLQEVAGFLSLHPVKRRGDCGDLLSPQLIESIEFENVTYAVGGKILIKEVSFKFEVGDRVAVIGDSGSGKSTLLDLMIGLLKPSSGRILVNGVALNNNNYEKWMANLMHVSQDNYIFNASILQNILLGKEYNKKTYCDVLKISQCQEFIASMNGGSSCVLTEHGQSLSGGQRQRIGIARALYKCGRLLILDEATSALDKPTEKSVLEGLVAQSNLTIVLTTHNPDLLLFCNKVIKLKNGEIVKG